MTAAQVFKISLIITNSSFQNYTQPDDHTRQSTEDTHGFKLFTPKIILMFIPGGWGGGGGGKQQGLGPRNLQSDLLGSGFKKGRENFPL